jgi:hypothetical protein
VLSAFTSHSNDPQPVLDHFPGHKFDYKVNKEQEVEAERGRVYSIEHIGACRNGQCRCDHAGSHNQTCAKQSFRNRNDVIDRRRKDCKHQDCIRQPNLQGAGPNTYFPGMLWVNKSSKVYHKPGSRYYGKTKEGKWMTEQDAVKAGYRAAENE